MEDEELSSSESEMTEGDEGTPASRSRRGVAEISLTWVGAGEKLPVMLFRADIVHKLQGPLTKPLESPHRLTFRSAGNDCKIVRTILLAHGFSEVPSSSKDFNLTWAGSSISGSTTRSFLPFQKINHFPHSFELTRKDKLCGNVQRMQEMKGMRHFNIIPKTFILPKEYLNFCSTFRRKQGTWIVKPVASSRGRGIYIITHPNQLARDEPVVVSRYMENPLCVDGFKFDMRLYVAVTSYDPLRVYLYEEGLARFASVRYTGGEEDLENHWMHLTNYSVNKKNADYVRCEDPDLEDYGNKWSLSALLRHLQGEGVEITELMSRVEDVIIKAILSVEETISAACRMYQPYRGNCFEIYGFDILIDENLQPWLLEVNLSPSLACDAPMDLRIKSNLVADLLSLTGIVVQDPYSKAAKRQRSQRPRSCQPAPLRPTSRSALSSEEAAAVRESREEYRRRGGFVRIFPTEDSWDLYGSFLGAGSSLNFVLHSQLYPERVRNQRPGPASLNSIITKRLQNSQVTSLHEVLKGVTETPAGLTAVQRAAVYTRRLPDRQNKLGHQAERSAAPPTALLPKSSAIPTSTMLQTSTARDTQTLIIKNAANMTKLQARQVFAAYLESVQRRLMKETSGLTADVCVGDMDQMNVDLIVRFLKKAASNLQSPFIVVVPDHQLPLRVRQRLLAKQLAEFVVLYRKETSQLESQDRDAPEHISHGLSSSLSEMSEGNLERLLSAYAKHTKSSSVFLTAEEGRDMVKQQVGSTAQPGSDTNRTLHSASGGQLENNLIASCMTPADRTDSVPYDQGVVHRSKPDSQLHPAPLPASLWVPSHTSPLQYSEVLLYSSSVSPGHRKSLDMLTRSLNAMIPNPQAQRKHRSSPPATKEEQRRQKSSSQGRLRPCQRSLSLQSLASTASDLSRKSDTPSGKFSSKSSELRAGTRDQSAKLARRSASLQPTIASKTTTYVSPYAQSACVRTATRRQRTSGSRSKDSCGPRFPLQPPLSEESIAQAMQRLCRRQTSKVYAAPRCPVSVQTLTESHRTQVTQPPPQTEPQTLWDTPGAAGHTPEGGTTRLVHSSPIPTSPSYDPTLYSHMEPTTFLLPTDLRLRIQSHSIAIQHRLQKAKSVPPSVPRPSDHSWPRDAKSLASSPDYQIPAYS